MGAMASQITSLTIVYSTVYSDADQRKHQSSASLAFVSPVNPQHKWPVTRKMVPFDDVIMNDQTTCCVTFILNHFLKTGSSHYLRDYQSSNPVVSKLPVTSFRGLPQCLYLISRWASYLKMLLSQEFVRFKNFIIAVKFNGRLGYTAYHDLLTSRDLIIRFLLLHYSDITWASKSPKSSATRWFVQQVVEANMKQNKNSKLRIILPLWVVDWTLLGRIMRKRFPCHEVAMFIYMYMFIYIYIL